MTYLNIQASVCLAPPHDRLIGVFEWRRKLYPNLKALGLGDIKRYLLLPLSSRRYSSGQSFQQLLCVRLATDRDVDAHVHAFVHGTPANELALMEMSCSCCIGHGSSSPLLRGHGGGNGGICFFLVCHYGIPT